ncbi:MAG: response regulator, partial [Oceanospirillum sp.]|nr:response regulator [Oceanospirillum sp.]
MNSDQAAGQAADMLSQLTVLFVDDEENMRISAEQCLQLEDFNVITCNDAKSALKHLKPGYPGILVTDIRMPGMSGLELMEQALTQDHELPVILLTGHGDIDTAVTAMHKGAFDFQQKPFDPDHFIRIVGHALRQRALVLENRDLRKNVQSSGVVESLLVGKSHQIEALRETVLDLADLPVNVLIHGETGSGKEQVATCLHQLSQ